MAVTEMNYVEMAGGVDLTNPDYKLPSGFSNIANNATVSVTGLTKKPKYIIISLARNGSSSTYLGYALLVDVENEAILRVGGLSNATVVDGTQPYSDWVQNVTSTGFTFTNLSGSYATGQICVYY